MATRHTLSKSNVRSKVEDEIGTYQLYDSRGGPARYVGRSKELRSRLLDYVLEYRFFTFDYHPNITEAYEREVNLFHNKGGTDKLDNDRHPRRPHTNVKCHRCGVHD